MKKHRDLLWIGLYYFIAIVVAITVFINLPLNSLVLKVLIADISGTLVVYGFSALRKNASIYDPYWSVAPLVMVVPFLTELNYKNALMIIVLSYWGIRLTLNWMYTFSDFTVQDWRYDYFKFNTKRWWPLVNLFGVHLMPTLIVFLVMLPVFQYLQVRETLNLLTIIGAFLAITATTVQWIADAQMHRFKQSNTSTVNYSGLWSLSRHPNYFGEILFWFSLFIMMYSVTPNSLYIIGPVINGMLFMFISIPLMEKRQKSRRPEYSQYIQSTNRLMPFPRLSELKYLFKK